MWKLIAVLLISCVLSPGSVFAQDGPPDIPATVSTTIEQVRGEVPPAFVVGEVTQSNSLLATDPFLNQFSNASDVRNAAHLTQFGDRNHTILSQYGRQNVTSIRLEGNDNRVEALQEGVGNRLGISVLGSGNQIPVSQIGMDNALSLELIDVNDLLLRSPGIEQIGNGVPLMIQITPNTP